MAETPPVHERLSRLVTIVSPIKYSATDPIDARPHLAHLLTPQREETREVETQREPANSRRDDRRKLLRKRSHYIDLTELMLSPIDDDDEDDDTEGKEDESESYQFCLPFTGIPPFTIPDDFSPNYKPPWQYRDGSHTMEESIIDDPFAQSELTDDLDLMDRRRKERNLCRIENKCYFDTIGFEEEKPPETISQLSDFELWQNMENPATFFIVSANSSRLRTFRVFMADDRQRIVFIRKKKPRTVLINTIVEIRRGQKTKAFEGQKLEEYQCMSFSIIHGGLRNLRAIDLIAEDENEFNTFYWGLMRRIRVLEESNSGMGFVVNILQSIGFTNKDCLSFSELLTFLYAMGCYLAPTRVEALLRTVGFDPTETFDVIKLIVIVREYSKRTEILEVFSAHTGNCTTMTAEQYLHVLHKVQKEKWSTIKTVEYTLKLLASMRSLTQTPSALSLRSFEFLLLSRENEAYNVFATRNVYQDMTQPLNQYFCCSSHNTYLGENQLTGRSSADMYIYVLQKGCRCIELDVWDGYKGEPKITHGNTMCSEITLRDVCHTIRDYAFVTSEYPLVLSVENHCSYEQQIDMAEIMKSIFKDMLPEPASKVGRLGSPYELRGKILIKDRNKVGKTPPEYAELIYLEGMSFTTFHLIKETAKPWNIISFDESKQVRLSRDLYVDLNRRTFSRVYPKGARVLSTNYNPQRAWNCGAQMVALNYQTRDRYTWVNDGVFADNGGCGYILKPSILREDEKFDPTTYGWNIKGVVLRIKLYSARGFSHAMLHNLKPKGASKIFKSRRTGSAIFTCIDIHGIPCDEASVKTRAVKDIFRAEWNEYFRLHIRAPWIATLSFRVKVMSENQKFVIAQRSIPLRCLKEGYRNIRLHDRDGVELPECNIICLFNVSEQ